MYQILETDIPYNQMEVLYSCSRFYTPEGGTRYRQMTVPTAKQTFYTVAGGFIQQKEVLYSRRKYQALSSDSLYSQIEVMCSGSRFNRAAGCTTCWQLTFPTTKWKLCTAEGGSIQQK